MERRRGGIVWEIVMGMQRWKLKHRFISVDSSVSGFCFEGGHCFARLPRKIWTGRCTNLLRVNIRALRIPGLISRIRTNQMVSVKISRSLIDETAMDRFPVRN